MRVIRVKGCGDCPYRKERTYVTRRAVVCMLIHRDVTEAVRTGGVSDECTLPLK